MVRRLVVLACLMLFAGGALGQDHMQMPKPGPEHEKLKAMEGDYDCVMEMVGMPSKSPAKSSMRVGLGGFWLFEKFEGEFGGMKFEGRGTMGYCPIRKKYTMSWIDSMSPTGMNMEGNFTSPTTMTLVGEGPNHEGKMAKFKSVTERRDDKTAVMTMFEVKNGKDERMFTITYTRK